MRLPRQLRSPTASVAPIRRVPQISGNPSQPLRTTIATALHLPNVPRRSGKRWRRAPRQIARVRTTPFAPPRSGKRLLVAGSTTAYVRALLCARATSTRSKQARRPVIAYVTLTLTALIRNGSLEPQVAYTTVSARHTVCVCQISGNQLLQHGSLIVAARTTRPAMRANGRHLLPLLHRIDNAPI